MTKQPRETIVSYVKETDDIDGLRKIAIELAEAFFDLCDDIHKSSEKDK